MAYQLGSFFNDVNSNSMFAYSIEQTYLFYSLHESLLSIIKGSRDYNIANSIMSTILENFMLDESNAGLVPEKTCKNLDIIHNNAYSISYELVQHIHKYYNKNIREFNDILNRLDLNNKLKRCKKFINDELTPPKRPDISQYKSVSSYNYDYNNIKHTIRLFNSLVNLFNAVYKDEKLRIKHINTNDVFISEFFMFFSHFMFAYTIDDKNINTDNSDNAVNFVLNNIHRSVNHLERGMLDIAKILVVSSISSGYIKDNEVIDIIKIRQNEYFSLAQSTTERINAYISWIKEIPQFKGHTEIKNLLDEFI